VYFAGDFFLGGWLFVLVLAPLARTRDHGLIAALVALALFLAAVVIERLILPHYVAPVTGLIFLLMAAGLGSWWRWKPGAATTQIGQCRSSRISERDGFLALRHTWPKAIVGAHST